MKGAMVPAAFGILLGLLLTIPAAGLLNSFLFGVNAWHWQTYAGALLVVLLVAVLAPIGPAVRASRVQPTITLRAD
jgi:ABC-type antimicrobial peptide transport system permease subunit